MTQEEKDLLLKDLSARLSYKVLIEYKGKIYRLHELNETGDYFSGMSDTEPSGVCSELGIEWQGNQMVKPYLRSISSMTEEEKKEERKLWDIITNTRNDLHYLYTDFLLSHHLDYRGLIERGLAFPAPENMYNII